MVISVCVWYTTFALTDTTLHDNSLVNGNVSGFFYQSFVDSRAFYLFEGPNSSPTTLSRIAGVIFTIIHILIAIPRFILIQLLELMVMMTSLCLWHIMRDFLKYKGRVSSHINDEVSTNE